MDHNYYRERISAFADNALPPYEQMALEGHLGSCAECCAALAQVRKLGEFVEKKINLIGDDYWDRQAQKIEQRLGIAQTQVTPVGRTKSWRGLGWKLTAAAASVALVGILAFYTKDSIWQKTDQGPAMLSPKPAEVLEQIDKNEDLKESSSVDRISRDSVATLDRKTRHSDGPPNSEQRMKERIVRTPASKPTPVSDNSNYKQLAPVADAISGGMQNTPKEESLAKPVEQVKVVSVPAPRVDELLKSAAGVKTKSDSGVVIRGGWAGEVEYLVDSAASKDTIGQAREAGKANIVKGTRDIVSKFDMNGLVSKSIEQNKVFSVQPIDSLPYWRTIRDSLEQELSPAVSFEKNIVSPQRIAPPSVATELTEKKDTTNPRISLLEAYFRIAQLSQDTVEVAAAADYLRKIADDDKSLQRKLAREYLDSLGVK